LLALGAVAVLAALALAVFGLGGGSTAPAPFAPIAQAAERTADLSGARFSGTGSGTSAGIQMQMTFSGEYNGQTDRSSMRMDVSSPQHPELAQMMGSMDAVQDGLVMYMSAPFLEASMGKPWMKIDLGEVAGIDEESLAGAPTAGTDARAMLDGLRTVSADARTIGQERVRGVATTHYAATIDPELAAAQARDAGSDFSAEVIEAQGAGGTIDVWIGDKDGLVHRIAQTVPFSLVGGSGSELRMTTDFYDFGIEPAIDVPPEDEVFDATEIGKQGAEDLLEGS
jgi:hypothetical protein